MLSLEAGMRPHRYAGPSRVAVEITQNRWWPDLGWWKRIERFRKKNPQNSEIEYGR